MPGKTTLALAIQQSAAGPQKPVPFVLKKIMDIPPPHILEEADDDMEKEKLSIWERTIPYDGETFHLEYMDLDEFLLENGIPVTVDEQENKTPGGPADAKKRCASKAVATTTDRAEDADAVATVAIAAAGDVFPATECATASPSSPSTEAPERRAVGRHTPSPIDPEAIEVDSGFQPDPTDLVLSSVPGGELFNPRKHKFSDEELKPQPMIKKAKKVYVPDEKKDDKYWSRRKKNNVAAKRSRDARRLKENQITVRASFLERENAALRQQVAELRKDCSRCKNSVARYEAKYGPL
ncbi:hypothetical protein NHX12_031179 [Muraenolepis orangiensis]|uniref:BZIP domain-containing protein n=1 Tax=Muraenolepis orangiensis TaxID=630683 RepID=A0A9Q0IJB6_9TELE|nr:hypothetical protein NHX12_031179 [Muraenolepis orangiensis]